MYRIEINKLKKWKLDKNRKPLIFLGARQVGKTWLLQEFGKCEYMKLNTVKKLLDILKTEKNEVLLSEELMTKAKKPLLRMLQ